MWSNTKVAATQVVEYSHGSTVKPLLGVSFFGGKVIYTKKEERKKNLISSTYMNFDFTRVNPKK